MAEQRDKIVLHNNTFTPRHLRRGGINRSGSVDSTKSKAFRGAALKSKRFIFQSASYLENGKVAKLYAEYCGLVDRDALRKGGSK